MTDNLIEIAKECGVVTVIHPHVATFGEEQLQQFTMRIEKPHKQRIAELEKDCDILATNYDAARRASRFSADVADQALADLKAAENQIEQLREALEKIADLDGNWGPFPETNEHWRAMAVVTAREALEETK